MISTRGLNSFTFLVVDIIGINWSIIWALINAYTVETKDLLLPIFAVGEWCYAFLGVCILEFVIRASIGTFSISSKNLTICAIILRDC